MGRRPTESVARRVIEEFLSQELGCNPERIAFRDSGYEEFLYSLCKDGEDGWSFWILEEDTTSYVHPDLSIEWYGTFWSEDA